MNRLPQEVECIWFESRPRIDIGIVGSKRGIVSFRGEDTAELLKAIVTSYAHLLAHAERLQRENKELRNIRGLSATQTDQQ